MADLDQIRGDLSREHDALDSLVADLAETDWRRPTPAEGWSIADQIGHLAFFDEQATLAVTNPNAFAASLKEIVEDVGNFMDWSVAKGRTMWGPGVLAWWREARGKAMESFAHVDPGQRIAWFGPPMKPASFISARLMETWAHAQDVADALDVDRQGNSSLRHIAHLAVLARAYSYTNRGLPAPTQPVRVELRGPEGEVWIWMEEGRDLVAGDAFDFCLVTTQRRHLDDTDLLVEGDGAREWMAIAQTYAGPPGAGRRPGQFKKRVAG